MKKSCLIWLVTTVTAGFVLWGCKDGNLFGSFREKGTGTTEAVLAEAQAALVDRNFAEALSYFQTVLGREPGNSEALYGAAQATMGMSGLNLGRLVSNIMGTDNASPSPSLSQALAASVEGVYPSPVDPTSILNGLNLDGLRQNINKIICYLIKIRAGYGDGSIPRDDVAVLVSLSIAEILRTVLRAVDNGVIDIRQDNNGFTVELLKTGNDLDAYCGGTTGTDALVKLTLDDLSVAVESFQAAVLKINPNAESTLSEVRADIESAFNELKSDINADPNVDNDCKTQIGGYNVGNLAPPSTDPGDCESLGTCCAL